MKFDGFDWDNGNAAKCEKHGLTLDDIEDVLTRDPLIAPDVNHSADEQRWIAAGLHRSQRPVFIAFTLRTKDDSALIRPISARFMHAKEAKNYGDQT